MLSLREEPFPIEAVRDLRGILRALYVARREAGAGHVALARIERVGRDLGVALELAKAHPIGTLGHAAAWARAERATIEAGDLIELVDGAREIVDAARRRARR